MLDFVPQSNLQYVSKAMTIGARSKPNMAFPIEPNNFDAECKAMDNITYIRAGWLIDGTGSPVQKDMWLHVRNGRIDEIQPYRDFYEDLTGNADLQLMDLSACTVLPALVDCHVHLFMSGSIDPEIRSKQLDTNFNDIKDRMDSHMQQYLEHGILAVRDGGDANGHALLYKSRYLQDAPYPTILKVAGRAWNRPGRYGRLISWMLPADITLANAIEQDQSDVDHIKIVNSGLNSLSEFGKQTRPQFDAAELIEAVRVAESKQRYVMVHANGHLPVANAVEAGCHSIEHGFFMGLENLKMMAEKQISWVPTAVTMQAYAEIMKSNGQDAGVAQKNLDHQLEQLHHARQYAVPVALGTDSGSSGVHHGRSVCEEMQLLMAAGYSLEESVRCATSNGVQLLGLKNTGRLISGFKANMLAVNGDPAKLPAGLHHLHTIIYAGDIFIEPNKMNRSNRI
jgi:imidazolonepropionase-like amidohydrolase